MLKVSLVSLNAYSGKWFSFFKQFLMNFNRTEFQTIALPESTSELSLRLSAG